MMDAVKYLKERKRMCDSYNNRCDGCGFGDAPQCNHTEDDNPEKAVAIVEKWSKDHPKKTRQSELLKMFPNAEIENGIAFACPKSLDKNVNCDPLNCVECTRKYWLEEVE